MAWQGHLAVGQWPAGQSPSRPALFLIAAASWPAFNVQILVACLLADDAKRALRSGRLDPRAAPTSLTELVAASASQKDTLWAGAPDVCPATTRLVHDAMGHWTRTRHFLFHAGVVSHVRVGLLCGNRVRDGCNAPASCGSGSVASSSGRSGRRRSLRLPARQDIQNTTMPFACMP